MESQRSQITKSILKKAKARGIIASDFKHITKCSNENSMGLVEDKPRAVGSTDPTNEAANAQS